MQSRKLIFIFLVFSFLWGGCSAVGAKGEELVAATPVPEVDVSCLKPFSSGDEPVLLPGVITEINTPTPASSSDLLYDTAYIKKAELVVEKSTNYPLVRVQGNLPTPCHKLLIEMEKPDSKNIIQIKVFSSVNLNVSCCQMLQPFNQEVFLGDLPSGTYKIWVGSGVIGEIEIP